MSMFAQDECSMINKIIKIYSANGDINWEDVKYILAFLNILKEEKDEVQFNQQDEDNEAIEIEGTPITDDEENDDEETEEEIEGEEADIAESDVLDTNENWEEAIIQAIKLNKYMSLIPKYKGTFQLSFKHKYGILE